MGEKKISKKLRRKIKGSGKDGGPSSKAETLPENGKGGTKKEKERRKHVKGLLLYTTGGGGTREGATQGNDPKKDASLSGKMQWTMFVIALHGGKTKEVTSS